MKGKIFLSGGGDQHKSFKLDTIFVEHLPPSSRILYIPHANKQKDYNSSIKWLQNCLSNANDRKKYYLVVPKNLKDLKDLSKFDAIYIGGGNTYHLLDLLRKTGLDEQIIAFHNSNQGIIYGGSAGAVILGKSIKTVSEEKILGVQEKGLNLLNDLSVICHFEDHKLKELGVIGKNVEVFCSRFCHIDTNQQVVFDELEAYLDVV